MPISKGKGGPDGGWGGEARSLETIKSVTNFNLFYSYLPHLYVTTSKQVGMAAHGTAVMGEGKEAGGPGRGR